MRQIINTKQTTSLNRQEFNGNIYQFQKGLGCIFSDNESMDDVVNYFLNKGGFELKSDKKSSNVKESTEKEKTTPKKSFFKKDKVEEKSKEKPLEVETKEEE